MAYSLEANPRLVSADYWGGVDFTNPNHFTNPPLEGMSVGPLKIRKATKAFLEGLSGLAVSGCEDENVYSQWFDPTANELPDGSMVIVEREYLAAGVGESRGVIEIASQIATSIESSPIARPFSRNWVNAQLSGYEDCGLEHALFPDINTVYARSLLWGILITKRSGQRGLVTWGLNDARIVDVETNTITATEADDVVEALPIELGTTRTELIADSTGFVMHGIERNRSIVIARRAEQASNKPKGMRQRHAGIREKISVLLEQLEPVVAPSAVS